MEVRDFMQAVDTALNDYPDDSIKGTSLTDQNTLKVIMKDGSVFYLSAVMDEAE